MDTRSAGQGALRDTARGDNTDVFFCPGVYSVREQQLEVCWRVIDLFFICVYREVSVGQFPAISFTRVC